MASAKNDFDDSVQPGKAAPAPFILVTERKDGQREIELSNVTIRTPGSNGNELVRSVNMTLKPGDRVIMTGASGTGKTTVTKAILNKWDYGSGIVRMPSGLKVMAISQQPHFPDTTLRGILNLAPEGKHQYSDRELREVLQTVGRDALIQHIPGQQVEILIDGMMEHAALVMKAYRKHKLAPPLVSEAQERIKNWITENVPKQFEVVQYVPEAQRKYLRDSLEKLFNDKLQMTEVPTALLDNMAGRLANDLDIALARPLEQHLEKAARMLSSGGLFPYTPKRAHSLALAISRRFGEKLDDYMANRDTDDIYREIRINEFQANYLTRSIAAALSEKAAGSNFKRGILSKTFNVLGGPLFALTSWMKAKAITKDLIDRTSFFMARQVVTGDTFKNQLSGGEKQKLMIAMVLLHKPDVVVLDEITAALDRETGETLYREMMDKMPKETIVLSIAHNLHIMKYHTHHAELANQTITLKRLDHDNNPALQTCGHCPHQPKP